MRRAAGQVEAIAGGYRPRPQQIDDSTCCPARRKSSAVTPAGANVDLGAWLGVQNEPASCLTPPCSPLDRSPAGRRVNLHAESLGGVQELDQQRKSLIDEPDVSDQPLAPFLDQLSERYSARGPAPDARLIPRQAHNLP